MEQGLTLACYECDDANKMAELLALTPSMQENEGAAADMAGWRRSASAETDRYSDLLPLYVLTSASGVV